VATGVTFRIRLPDGTWADESELPDRLAELRGRSQLEGALVVSGNDPGETVIEDDVNALAHNVCLRTVPDLVQQRAFAVPYFDKQGSIRLDPAGLYVRLSGDYVEEAVVPQLGLIAGLVDCADRIAAFLRALGDRDGQAGQLEAQVTATRETISAVLRRGW
jgi:hypothetical protein